MDKIDTTNWTYEDWIKAGEDKMKELDIKTCSYDLEGDYSDNMPEWYFQGAEIRKLKDKGLL